MLSIWKNIFLIGLYDFSIRMSLTHRKRLQNKLLLHLNEGSKWNRTNYIGKKTATEEERLTECRVMVTVNPQECYKSNWLKSLTVSFGIHKDTHASKPWCILYSCFFKYSTYICAVLLYRCHCVWLSNQSHLFTYDNINMFM